MATKTLVETPAGESIEVLDDRQWLELTGADEGSLRQFSPLNRKIWVLRALFEHGEFTSQSGRATGILDEWCATNYPNYPGESRAVSSVTMLFAGDMMVPVAEREIRGKRCFSIKLLALPRSWFMKMSKLIAEQPLGPTPDQTEAIAAEQRIDVPVEQPVEESGETITDQDIQQLLDSVPGVDAPTIFEEMPPLELSIATQVAMSLLTTVVEIITAGSGAVMDDKMRKLQTDFREVSERLSQRLTENDSLSRQLRTAGDEIRALRHERDGLRSRLRATEANLTAALKGDAINAINGEIQRRVDSIMRVAPTSDKGE
jgi:regulator of replication initiation timing